jgi:hypothetical protein
MASDQKRPPPTHGTRAAIMSSGLNAAARSGLYGQRIHRGLPAAQVYRPFRFTGQPPCLSVANVYRPAPLPLDRQGLPAVQVYRPSRFTRYLSRDEQVVAN